MKDLVAITVDFCRWGEATARDADKTMKEFSRRNYNPSQDKYQIMLQSLRIDYHVSLNSPALDIDTDA